LAVGANAALAGAVTGAGKTLKNSDGSLNGNSICAFSGLNDNYFMGIPLPDEDGFVRVRSWGHLALAVRVFLTSIGLSPGVACNPTRAGGEP
jgi:hypothetical protein